MTTIKCYHDQEARNVIQAWYAQQDGVIRGQFAGLLQVISDRPVKGWPASIYKVLMKRSASSCLGLDELILDVEVGEGYETVHIRILGFCGPGDDEFTMLYPFNKNIDADYGGPCTEAQQRKREVQGDWRRAQECEFPQAISD